MGFNITRKTVGGEKLSWLDSRHAVSNAQTGTLDAAAFTEDVVVSGTPLAEVGGKFVPYTAGAVDGSEVLAGFNLYGRDVSNGDEPCAVLDHGRVYVDALPVAFTPPADAGLFIFA